MLLPEGYITTPDQSFGRTVWEMGSVERVRSWKTCSLGSLRFHTTAYRQQSSRVCNPKEDKEFGLRYCSTFQSGVLATAVGTSAGQNQQAQTCCCKISANRDLAAPAHLYQGMSLTETYLGCKSIDCSTAIYCNIKWINVHSLYNKDLQSFLKTPRQSWKKPLIKDVSLLKWQAAESFWEDTLRPITSHTHYIWKNNVLFRMSFSFHYFKNKNPPASSDLTFRNAINISILHSIARILI